jgi:hypothetical protein
LTVIDANLSVQAQQRLVREIVKQELAGWEGLPMPEGSTQILTQAEINAGKGKK